MNIISAQRVSELAKEAGFYKLPVDKRLERFAALVAEPWIETNKALAKELIELKKEVKQEPVKACVSGVCPNRANCDAAQSCLYTEAETVKQEPVAKKLDLIDKSRILAGNQRNLDLTAGKTVASVLSELCDHILELYAAPVSCATNCSDAKAIQIDVDTDRIIKSDPLYLQGRAEALEEAFNAGYLAGFCSSREGYNGEYPFSDKRIAPDSVVRWSKEREDSFNKFCLDKNEN